MPERVDFLVRRDDLRATSWQAAATEALAAGQVRLAVDRFALTANNITYAVFGEAMHYWDFFPAPEGFGRVPVWGFGDVVESTTDGLEVGERVYGYLPMSSEVVLTCDRVGRGGFREISPWRVALPAAYNSYRRVAASTPEQEALEAVFRPLFTTSFLIDDQLADEDFHGAATVVVSSASSKTSLTLGHLLGRRDGVRTVGLTSAQHVGFVEATGCFASVLSYDALPDLDVAPAVLVDMAGSATVRAAVHEHLGEQLRYSCAVGATHWEDPGRSGGLPGPAPVLFFAPARMDKRHEDWGPGGLESRTAQAWAGFLEAATWVEPTEHRGQDAVGALYAEVLEGGRSPREAPMAVLHSSASSA